MLIGTFLLGPYLVGLLVWWLLREMPNLPVRLIVATLTACAAGLLAYGSLGYLPPALFGLF